jgi:hypothetical protein
MQAGCGERAPAIRPVDLEGLGPPEFLASEPAATVPVNQAGADTQVPPDTTFEIDSAETILRSALDPEVGRPSRGPQGVRGWLLFLCINLTIIIPFSCLYEANSVLETYYSATPVESLLFRHSLVFHLGVLAATIFLAVFSFHAGRKLWEARAGAINTAKRFLIAQLFLMILIIVSRPWLISPLVGSPGGIRDTIPRLLPFLSHFSVWYLYLSFSRRVRNTYGPLAEGPPGWGPPAQLPGSGYPTGSLPAEGVR